jgi:hypothetical protein
MDIIVVESSLDDRLILRVCDDMRPEACECTRDDIHDRVHPETCRSSDTYGEVCVGGHDDEKYMESIEKTKKMQNVPVI